MTYFVGDNSPDLTGTVPANLTGATAEVHLRRPDGTVLTAPVTPAAYDPVAGTTSWSYTWATGDLSQRGRWVAELQVTFAGGRVQTFGPTAFTVQPQIA